MKAKVKSDRFSAGVAPVFPVTGFTSTDEFLSGSKTRGLIGTRCFFERLIPENGC
jgi:hypothetical protein